MFIVLAATIWLAPGPRPCDGPAWPLRFLKGLELRGAGPGRVWTRGCYTAWFQYLSPKPVAELAAQYRSEVRNSQPMPRKALTYSNTRLSGSIGQSCTISLPGIWSDPAYDRRHGTKHVRLTAVRLDEFLLPGAPPPARWYGPAIAPKPPAPMVRVPFLPSAWTDTVMVTSFRELQSFRGFARQDRDALMYDATLPGTYSDVKAKAEKWFQANGYVQTPSQSYFRAGAGFFEIELIPSGANRGALARMYFSKLKATHPMVRNRK